MVVTRMELMDYTSRPAHRCRLQQAGVFQVSLLLYPCLPEPVVAEDGKVELIYNTVAG